MDTDGLFDPWPWERADCLGRFVPLPDNACEIACELPKSACWFRRAGGRVHKTVRWFLMHPMQQVGAPDTDEIDVVAWCTVDKAQERLTYAADRSLLQQELSSLRCMSSFCASDKAG